MNAIYCPHCHQIMDIQSIDKTNFHQREVSGVECNICLEDQTFSPDLELKQLRTIFDAIVKIVIIE